MPKTPRKQGGRLEPPPPARPARRTFPRLLAVALAAFVILVAAVAWFAYAGVVNSRNAAGPATTADTGGAADSRAADAGGAPRMTDGTAQLTQSLALPLNARFGPHTQAALPPLPFGPSPPARPPDVVRAVYRFAAEHPEVLGYVPCYCGCERSGHRGNDDCFVTARASNGDVTAWEPHGMT